jgi:hypothetical protein
VWTWRSDRRLTVFGLSVAIAVISLLWFGGIGRAGLGHAYYSGSARTLAHNPQWLFSGAFDPGGFVTVDKPRASALANGADLANLDIVTIRVKTGEIFPPCGNCASWVPGGGS